MLEALEEAGTSGRQPGRRRLIFLTVAAVSSLLTLAVAIVLGALGFNVRRSSIHEARLDKLIKLEAHADQVTKGLEAEHSALLMSTRNAEEARIAAEQWGGRRRADIQARAARYVEMRVFRATDMYYFLYFDGEGRVRDFIYVSV